METKNSTLCNIERKTKRKTLLLRHIAVTFLAVAIVGVFAFVTVKATPLDPIIRTIEEFSFTDIYYEIQQEKSLDTCRAITIVDLPNDLVSRRDIAQTIADIEKCHPKVVGVDCIFDGEGEDFEGNDSLISVASTYKNIVFAERVMEYSEEDCVWHSSKHSFFVDNVSVIEGSTHFPRMLYDSMKRKAPVSAVCKDDTVPSFATQLANHYADSVIIAINQHTDEIRINFTKTNFIVLNPDSIALHPDLIRDHIVLFGAVHADNDMHWTPIGQISGIELHAYALNTIIQNKEIRDVPFVLFCLISLVIIFLVQVLQSIYINRTRLSKNMFIKHVVGSAYILNILTFFFTSVFVIICFYVFDFFNISFNLGWALSAIAFLETSRSLYASIKEYVNSKKDKYKFLNEINL